MFEQRHAQRAVGSVVTLLGQNLRKSSEHHCHRYTWSTPHSLVVNGVGCVRGPTISTVNTWLGTHLCSCLNHQPEQQIMRFQGVCFWKITKNPGVFSEALFWKSPTEPYTTNVGLKVGVFYYGVAFYYSVNPSHPTCAWPRCFLLMSAVHSTFCGRGK